MKEGIAAEPARLHVLFARSAPVGVIIRRGPSRQVRVILWRTDTDTFEAGQWLKGRIYGERVSLSPDGNLMAYFAMDARAVRTRRAKAEDGSKGSWIALSRPPYLTALAIWFLGDTWGGYSSFFGNRSLGVSIHYDLEQDLPIPEGFQISRISRHHDVLKDRGWKERSWAVLMNPRYRKPLRNTSIFLEFEPWYRKLGLANRKSRFWLINSETRQSRELDCQYAEVDPHGRLVVLNEGKVFAAAVQEDLTFAPEEMADLNEMRFQPLPPPDWARQWPESAIG